MRSVFIWLRDNLSTAFSIIGILLTLYFSVFYVPNYYKILRLRQIENINNEVINNLQELVYNGFYFNMEYVSDLIKGKELKTGIEFPLSVDEVMIEIRESFLNNSFIPLDKRSKIVCVIDSLRQLKAAESTNHDNSQIDAIKETKKNETTNFLTMATTFVGVLASLFGLVGVFYASKRRRIDEKIKSIEDNAVIEEIETASDFEKRVYARLSEIYGDSKVTFNIRDNNRADFLVEYPKGTVTAFEVMYSSTSNSWIRHVIRASQIERSMNIPLVVVVNYELTHDMEDYVKDFKTKNNLSFRFIQLSQLNIEMQKA